MSNIYIILCWTC